MAEKNNFVHGIAYGKLYLAGEYAILEDYSKALITSVDKKIIAFVEPGNEITIFDTLNKISVGLYEKNNNFKLIQEFLIFLQQYTQSDKKFALTIYNELHGEDKKYGLGSSGAVLVAITKAMLNFEKIKFDDITVFKLVTLFNLTLNISGSMGDVAASLTKGITYYQKFNSLSVKKLIENHSITEIINTDWDGLVIKNIIPKASINIFARWTGECVDTKEHVKLWKENKDNFKEEYSKFVSKSNSLVTDLAANLEDGNTSEVLENFRQLRSNLHYLESFSHIPMETISMKKYIDTYPAGKQSGSGSGDIVLGFDKSDAQFYLILNLEKL